LARLQLAMPSAKFPAYDRRERIVRQAVKFRSLPCCAPCPFLVLINRAHERPNVACLKERRATRAGHEVDRVCGNDRLCRSTFVNDAIAMAWRVAASCAWIGPIAANTIRTVRLSHAARQCSQALAGPEARLPPRKNARRSLRTTKATTARYKDASTSG